MISGSFIFKTYTVVYLIVAFVMFLVGAKLEFYFVVLAAFIITGLIIWGIESNAAKYDNKLKSMSREELVREGINMGFIVMRNGKIKFVDRK